jgi:Xaa-Pro aminopeptidase
MRDDILRLMRARNVAGIAVFAYDRYSPAMYYVSGARLGSGVYIQALGGRELLAHDEAEDVSTVRPEVERATFTERGLIRIFGEEGAPAPAFGRLIAEMCADLGIDGPIGLFGDLPAAFAYALIRRMHELNANFTIDTSHPDLLLEARATKDAWEVEAIRRASRGVVQGYERTVAFLSSLRTNGAGLVEPDGRPATVGSVRRLIQQALASQRLAEGSETIVSFGRDAGIPHSIGNDDDVLRPGVPLVMDIFPAEAGGGYHSDFTRTVCVGRAPDELRALYADVLDAVKLTMSTLEVGRPCGDYDRSVCDLFEARGHPTLRSQPDAETGYIHSLGHGVGLSVHEEPRIGSVTINTRSIEPGMVFTVEPGLYYPEREMGVRIEDVIYVRPDGTFENLTPAPYQLEVQPAA